MSCLADELLYRSSFLLKSFKCPVHSNTQKSTEHQPTHANMSIPENLLKKFECLEGIQLIGLGNELQERKFVVAEYLSELTLFEIKHRTDTEVVNDWTTIKKALDDNTFSKGHLRMMVNLALNVRGVNVTDTPLITPDVPSGNAGTYNYNTQPDLITMSAPATYLAARATTSTSGAAIATESNQSRAMAICFICAIYMRLFTKETSHIEKALPSAKAAFGSLYNRRSTFLNSFRPVLSWAEKVKNGLNAVRICTNTLGYRLAVAEEKVPRDSPNYGICRFLLFQHLEMVGMQTYKFTRILMDDLNIFSPEQFLRWASVLKFRDTIQRIYEIWTEWDNAKDPNRTFYWKYAKLSNDAYFVGLNARRNQYYTAMLVRMLKRRGLAKSDDYSDPENMVAIKNMNERIKANAFRDADMMLEAHTSLQTVRGEGAGLA